MAINGISVTKEDNYVLCCVDELSDELKAIIRTELTAICHGKSEVEEYALDRHSYKKTLTEFLTRYEPKAVETKKGMMGEFVAHLIINKALPQLKTVTILFNKEELSIRKGFDLTYVEIEDGIIWYGEIKSGELNDNDTPDEKNKNLLNESKNGMKEFLTGLRPNLWNSVIIDVGLSIAQNHRKRVKDLFDGDIKQIEAEGAVKKNAVLISVLFHDTQNRISPKSVAEHLAKIVAEDIFLRVILFSIQKSTFSRIEEFLRAEIGNQ
ncbi:MAG: SAVED domain-containing protein [Gammaproteobacteria bacterium]|nr:SAVED domain-containing protein [Gammaproteobacteria bacterium]